MRWLGSYRHHCFPGLSGALDLLRANFLLYTLALLGLAMPSAAALASGIRNSMTMRPLAPAPLPVSPVGNCTSCHRMDPLFSHPVEVTPSMQVPADLPLQSGRMTCLTCHENVDASAHASARQSHDPLLRNADSAAALCARCHTSREQDAKSMHAATLNRAHLPVPDRLDSAAAADQQALYDETYACLACHDGTMATGVNLGGDVGTDTHASSHPVGTPYNHLTRPAGAAILVPASSLDRRIRLFDQRLACGSCHSPYSNENKLLVMSNYRSRLCLSCHRD